MLLWVIPFLVGFIGGAVWATITYDRFEEDSDA